MHHVVLEPKHLAMKHAMQGHAMRFMRAVCDAGCGDRPDDVQKARQHSAGKVATAVATGRCMRRSITACFRRAKKIFIDL